MIMPSIEINGKKITNPIVFAIIGLSAIAVTALIAAIVIFLILPFTGIVLSLSVGLTIVILIAVLIALPFIIMIKIILWILLKPFR